MYVEVIVNAPVEGTFHYHVPPDLEGRVCPGSLVEVSFGRAYQQAVVARLDPYAPPFETKPIRRLLDAEPVVQPVHIALSEWMCKATLSHLSDCLRLFLPPGLSKKSDILVSLLQPEPQSPANTEVQKRVLSLLRRRGLELRGRQIARALPHANWRAAVGQLARRGVLGSTPVLDRPSARPRTVQTVCLAIPPEQMPEALQSLGRARRQRAVLEWLAEASPAEPCSVKALRAETAAPMASLLALAEAGLIVFGTDELIRDPLAVYDFAPSEAPSLTSDQQSVWAAVCQALAGEGASGAKPILLHGVTGSGKTEIYLRAAEMVVREGRQAIILVPEISLTPQTVRRFAARFRRLGVVHSRLSAGERYDTWRRARAGQLDVIVGARSALFTPLPDLGLIVLDEAHDASYKQAPPVSPPYYHARAAAAELGRLCGAAVIFGTATPDLVSAYRAQRGEYQLLSLPQRVLGHKERVRRLAGRFDVPEPAYLPDDTGAAPDAVYAQMPPVQVVDMRQELRAGNRSIFSRALRAALEKVLGAGEQAILFMNRRGTSTTVMCRDCGYLLVCPRCDRPLVYHGPAQALTCHHCAYHTPPPRACPVCGGARIKYLGTGTERIEQAVREAFPGARTLRWDRDTVDAAKDAHERILQQFVNGEADILIGTQMIAKGLDLPLVTLVGVVLADVGLTLPDYRATERTFQVLAQVAGRAGRGLLGGRVVLQTYSPAHIAITAAAQHDYEAFYAHALANRRDLGYPPFTRLARVLVRHPRERAAQAMAEQAAAWLRERIRERRLGATDLIGPVPCFFTRLAGLYRWQVVVRGPDPVRALDGLPSKPEWAVDVDPVDLL